MQGVCSSLSFCPHHLHSLVNSLFHTQTILAKRTPENVHLMPTLTVTLLVVTAALVCLPAVTAQCNPGQFTDGAGACVDCTAGTFSTSKSTHIRKGNLTQYLQMELLLHVALAPRAVLITYKGLWAAALAALDSFRYQLSCMHHPHSRRYIDFHPLGKQRADSM